MLIHRNAIDPKTEIPHPIVRIENAIKEAKVHIDFYKRAEEQVGEIIKKLQEILPIKYEVRKIAIKIPAQYSGQGYGIFKNYGRVLKDEWQKDGSLIIELEIAAGLQAELFDKLNRLTHGQVESKII